MQSLRAAAALWTLGLWEGLQLQRCVVFFVLDQRKALGTKVLHCTLLNGCIFLGSIALWELALQPVSAWLLGSFVAPCLGSTAAYILRKALQALFHAIWLFPVYMVAMFVSMMWYQDVASLAYQVKEQASSRGAGRSKPQKLDDVAQEVYRTVFFVVFFAQVSLLGLVPLAGRLLSVLFLSWLYAYYCYDYKWTLQAVPLVERLAFFERRWAFFAGFGLPMALSTALLSFYVGAAVLAVLFPAFILVACDSDLNALHGRVPGQEHLWHLPIFAMAMWPTQRIVRTIFGAERHGAKH